MFMIPIRTSHNIKVLIVDDSPVVRERLATMLEELSGIEVVGQAKDVAGAIRTIQKLKPDVVILDIVIPGGNGVDVLKNIRHDKAGPMVIILTNYPYPEYRQKCLHAGANFFLDKTTEFDQIPALFEQLKQGLGPDQALPA
jgi:DNA-binding NarL/FixJ family response regulator